MEHSHILRVKLVASRWARPTFLLLMIGIALYLALYIPNTMCGGYWGRPVSGMMEFAPGMAFHSAFLWQPRIGYEDTYNESPAGWLWSPLIHLDRRYFHRSLDLFNSDDEALIFSTNRAVKWHPKALEEAKQYKIEKAIWRSHCVEDAQFCLESALDFRSKADIHFLALLIFDRDGSNGLAKLRSSTNAHPMSEHAVRHVIEEVQAISKSRLEPTP
jgi:hypothetical protein